MKLILLFLSFFFVSMASANYRVHVKKNQGHEEIVSVTHTPTSPERLLQGKKILRQLPYYIEGTSKMAQIMYEEYEIPDSMASARLSHLTTPRPDQMELKNVEVKTIVQQGPLKNRINLTILGDGYTLAEKDKFFQDAERTARGLFEGQTFATYLPLFNIHAVFVASKQSGLGDGSPINTAFQLYRTPKGSKRAIYPGNTAALEKALTYAPATDYPIVIANDNYYGGLGGRFAISTSSERSGLIVLRHELGHNFGEVGEEYDNGTVYMGANSSSTPNVSWKQWIEGETAVHEAKILSGSYVWSNLKNKPYLAQFQIPPSLTKMFLEISSVGWNTPGDVAVTLNSHPLPLIGDFHDDRSFYSIKPEAVVPSSNYQLRIEEKIPDGNNVLGFAVAFAAPEDYDFTPDKIAAFATYDENGRKTYRPTHSSCIMRDMEVQHFCAVDIENMWHKFLDRVRLIDEVTVTTISNEQKSIEVHTQKLSGLTITWSTVQNGVETEMTALKNKMQWAAPAAQKGMFRVRVSYRTPEVRVYKANFDDVNTFTL